MKAGICQRSFVRDQRLKVETARFTPNASRLLRPAAYCLLLAAFMLASCGKKGPPTLKSYEKPEAPAGLKAIHREDKIILFWSYGKKENLKEFNILRADIAGPKQENGDFKKIASVPKDKNSHIDSDFKTAGTGSPYDVSYKYKVIAGSLKKILSNDSNIVTVKPVAVPPAPENISFRADNAGLMILWESAGEGIAYNIYKSAEKGKYGINPINNEPIKTASYTDSMEPTRIVYYTVRGLLNNNELRDEGAVSDEIEVNPANFIPSRPEGLQLVKAGDKVVLSWKENPETWVVKYKIYRKLSEKDEFKAIGESVTPAYTDREKTGTKHIYTVTAAGPSKESEPSKVVSVGF